MLKLTVEKREVFGKKLAGARVAGKLPVVVYGMKTEATSYFVSQKDFKKVLEQAGESTVISLQPEGEKASREVLIHDVALDPVSDEPIHADFYVIDKTKAIEIAVPLHFDGVSPAVKDLGGTLVRVLHELTIEALPLEIPHGIPVDIAALATLASQILVKDLKLPAGIKKVLNDPEAVVASISVAKEEPIEEAPVDLTAIEVEKKGKKEEEGAPADAAAGKGDGEAKKEGKKEEK